MGDGRGPGKVETSSVVMRLPHGALHAQSWCQLTQQMAITLCPCCLLSPLTVNLLSGKISGVHSEYVSPQRLSLITIQTEQV